MPRYSSDRIEEINKIDLVSTDGLTGISNSLAYRTSEIEKHFHNKVVWVGKLAVQTATNWAEVNGLTPFVAISGNGAFGSDPNDEAQVFGSADSGPANGVYMDAGTILISTSTATSPYVIRLVWGTGTLADAIAAGQYTTTMFQVPASSRATPVSIAMPRVATATQIWVQCKNATDNATISFFIGGHFYAG